ncbi:hypothetical protein DFJ43DRAFT_1072329 [Lentinula guzmanii]|uniref:Uncharacterized protein n=1 Tax=Lentinula guzmanii TaxID=2804957 RepID=A0AA38JIB5_9AGAR|nr:hypothetical protein DFJ43DRAFT_1072329 [Lentinula guzmanii]
MKISQVGRVWGFYMIVWFFFEFFSPSSFSFSVHVFLWFYFVYFVYFVSFLSLPFRFVSFISLLLLESIPSTTMRNG